VCKETFYENINSMKLEEAARAALAEANYKRHRDKILSESHLLEGENLELGVASNTDRGGRGRG
jgi:hypothetical protein